MERLISVTKITTRTHVCTPEEVGLTAKDMENMTEAQFVNHMKDHLPKCEECTEIITHHIRSMRMQ